MIKRISRIQLNQLVEFGLNPYQWVVSKEADDQAELINLDDSGLKLRALLDATNNSFQIESLEWMF